MMLRSSSTPVFGSLLPSLSESPGSIHHPAEFHGSTPKHPLSSVHQSRSLLSRGGCQNLGKFVAHSPSIPEIKNAQDSGSKVGLRRVLSEGNMEELAHDTSYGADELSFFNQRFKKSGRRSSHSSLDAIPSFSLSRMGVSYEDGEADEEDVEFGMGGGGNPVNVQNLVSEETRTGLMGYGMMKTGTMKSDGGGVGKMYLAAGVGVCDIGFLDGNGHGCGGGSHRPVAFGRDGGESGSVSMEAHYKRMLVENHFDCHLWQSKGDFRGAEEYYSRAILADPEDGEVLSQYAALIWESRHDKDRANSYFERAIQASSENRYKKSKKTTSVTYKQHMQIFSGMQRRVVMMRVRTMVQILPSLESYYSNKAPLLLQLLRQTHAAILCRKTVPLF